LLLAAKNVMSSVPDYVLIESGFTVAQWLIVGPLTVVMLRRSGMLGDHARESPRLVA
jgi:hypothetical protein